MITPSHTQQLNTKKVSIAIVIRPMVYFPFQMNAMADYR